MNRSKRDAARILCLAALAALVTGCSTLFVGASDRRCAHDLTAVQDSAAHARAELEDGVTLLCKAHFVERSAVRGR